MKSSPLWSAESKHLEWCSDCPRLKDSCVLKGRRETAQPYRLIFLFETPDIRSAEPSALDPTLGAPGNFVRSIVKHCEEAYGLKDLEPSVLFAVGAPTRKKPRARTIKSCMPYSRAKLIDLADEAPEKKHVIVAFGNVATEVLKLRETNVNKARGQVTTTRIGRHTFDVVPTLSIKACLKTNNYFKLVLRDIGVAIAHMFSDAPLTPAAEQGREYQYPEFPDEVGKLVDYVIGYTGSPNIAPEDWPIALDLETTGFDPWAPNARIIAMSVSWGEGLAATVLLDHKNSPVPEEQRPEVWAHIRRLFACRKPTIWHNALFDFLWLLHLKLSFGNFWWDTMLGEHFLNEDAKGFYSLKIVLLNYAPQFAGYEDELWRLIKEHGTQSAADYVRYTRASEDLAGSVPELEGMEDEYVLAAYDHFLCKEAPTLDGDGNPTENSLEKLSVSKKAKNRLRNKLRKIYTEYGVEPPPCAKVVTKGPKGQNNGEFEKIPIDVMRLYAAIDADLCRRVCKGQRVRMKKEGVYHDGHAVMENLYVPGVRHLSPIRYAGIRIDREKLEQWLIEIKELDDAVVEIIRRDVLKSYTVPFNPNSPVDVADILTKVLHIPFEDLDKTETGLIGTSKDALDRQRLAHPGTLIETFCYYMALHGAAKSALGTLKGIANLSVHDGKVHTKLNLNATTTGRLSSSSPNFQNLSAKYLCAATLLDHETGEVLHHCDGWAIKELLLPRSAKFALYDIDVSAAEIRVLCATSKDPKLTAAVNAGLDVPSYITAEAFTRQLLEDYPHEKEIAALPEGADPDNEKTREAVYAMVIRTRGSNPDVEHLRTAAKRVLYGNIYGAGPETVASQIFGGLSTDEVERAAQVRFAVSVQGDFFRLFPTVATWIKEVHRTIKRDKELSSLTRRHRRFPLAERYFKKQLGANKRSGVNFMVQGPASDIVLSQLCEIEDAIKELGGSAMLTVHDSIVGDIPLDKVPQLEEFFDHWMIARVKERFGWLPVPYKYGLSVGINYKDTVDYAAYLDGTVFVDKDNPAKAAKANAIANELRRRLKEFYGG